MQAEMVSAESRRAAGTPSQAVSARAEAGRAGPGWAHQVHPFASRIDRYTQNRERSSVASSLWESESCLSLSLSTRPPAAKE